MDLYFWSFEADVWEMTRLIVLFWLDSIRVCSEFDAGGHCLVGRTAAVTNVWYWFPFCIYPFSRDGQIAKLEATTIVLLDVTRLRQLENGVNLSDFSLRRRTNSARRRT